MTSQEVPHWRVGNRLFLNHLSAINWATETREKIVFDFFDDTFKSCNWLEEPQISWKELLRLRALQLREQYDYLRLWYSGGVDSHTALNSFLNNRIPLDEIVLMRASPISQFEDLGNSEISKVALPFLKHVKNLLGSTKVTLLDIGHEQYRNFYGKEGWQFRTNTFEFRPTTISHIREMFPDLSKLRDHVRFCDIQGGEKPRITQKEDGQFYAFYWDVQIGVNFGAHHVEQFYLTPNMPEVHIKQCHMLKNHVKEVVPEGVSVDSIFKFDSPYYEEVNRSCRDPLFVNYSMGKGGSLRTPKCLLAMEQAEKGHRWILDSYHSELKNERVEDNRRFQGGDIYNGLNVVKSKEFRLGR